MSMIIKKRNKKLRTSPYPSRDLTNKKFNKLSVLSFDSYKNYCNRRRCYYKCKCDCGKEVVISHDELTHGRISCGCALVDYRKNIVAPNKKPIGEAAFNKLFADYKTRAKRIGVRFSLSKKQFKQLTKGNCFYCNTEPYQITQRKYYNGPYIYNGIDRKNNNVGYEINNVVSCCGVCNKAKTDLPLDVFLNWLERIVDYRK